MPVAKVAHRWNPSTWETGVGYIVKRKLFHSGRPRALMVGLNPSNWRQRKANL